MEFGMGVNKLSIQVNKHNKNLPRIHEKMPGRWKWGIHYIMCLKECTSLSLVLCIYWLLTILTTEAEIVPFINDNPTNTNCSWTFVTYCHVIKAIFMTMRNKLQRNYKDKNTNRHFKYKFNNEGSSNELQYCNVLQTAEFEKCRNPTDYPATLDDRAVAVEGLKLTEITKLFNFTDNPQRNGYYTCIQMSYFIDKSHARRTHAVQFELLSVDTQVDRTHGYLCQVHNYSHGNTNGLAYWSVISDYDNCRTTDARCREARKVFIYDKFCGIVPGAHYYVSVRTLPVDYSRNKDYDTKVTKRYPTESIKSGSCDDKPEDMRCRKNKQARWKPFVNVHLDNSKRSKDVFDLTITFDVAPSDYGFDKYFVVLYGPHTPEMPRDYLYNYGHIFSNQDSDLTNQSSKLSCTVTELPLIDCYDVRVYADASGASICKIGIDERAVECTLTSSTWQTFCPKENPCLIHTDNEMDMCGPFGNCTVIDDGTNYTCSCRQGYQLRLSPNRTCIKNPCLNDTDNEMDLCGPFGNCTVIDDGPNYTCSCRQGYQLRLSPNRTCIKEPTGNQNTVIIYTVIAGLAAIIIVAVSCIYSVLRWRDEGQKGKCIFIIIVINHLFPNLIVSKLNFCPTIIANMTIVYLTILGNYPHFLRRVGCVLKIAMFRTLF